MLICSARAGWIRDQKTGLPVANKNAVSPATERRWQVQKMDGAGWVSLTPPVNAKGLADDLLEEYKNTGGEYRLVEI